MCLNCVHLVFCSCVSLVLTLTFPLLVYSYTVYLSAAVERRCCLHSPTSRYEVDEAYSMASMPDFLKRCMDVSHL